MFCKYYLTLGKIRKEIPKEDFKNWDEVEYSMSRKDFTGVVRSFSSDFEFVGDTADRITDAFMEYGLYGEGEIEVYGIQNNWTYTKIFACPLYFASYSSEKGVVKIKTLDNSLAAIIKAQKGTTYEYLMSDFSDSKDIPFYYDGVELDNVVTFKLGPDANSNNISEFSTIDGQEYQKLPMNMVSDEIIGNKCLKWGEGQKAEAFEVKTKEELALIYGIVPSDHGFPYGAYTDAYNSLMVNKYMDGDTHPYIRVRVNADFELELPKGVTTDDMEIWITTTVLYGAVVDAINSDERVGFWRLKVEEGTSRYYIKDADLTLFPNYTLMLMARFRQKKQVLIRVLSSSLQVLWTGKFSPSYMEYVKPETLLRKLMESMVDNRRNFTCSIDVCEKNANVYNYSEIGSWDTDTRIKDTILIPMDTITNNPSRLRYLRTSFSNFCKWMEAVFGYVYFIKGDNLTFCHRTKLFGEYVPGKDFDNVSEVSYDVGRDCVFSSLEVGYDNTNDNAFNMKYEFNRKMLYETGVVNTSKKVSLISPYRADSIGFELAYESGIKTASDDKNSQSGLWFICVHDELRGIRKVKAVTSGVGAITGEKKGMFNYVFSPIYNLKANSFFISSFVRQLKLASSNINDIKFYVDIGQMSMKRDFYASKDDCNFFKHPLFTIGELSFVTDEQSVPEDLSKPISILWKGKKYIGYVLSIDAKYEFEKSCKYKIIVKQIVKI